MMVTTAVRSRNTARPLSNKIFGQVGVLLQALDELARTLLVLGSNRIDRRQDAQSVLDSLGGVEAEVLAVHRADELDALRQAVRYPHGDGGSRKTEGGHRGGGG